MSFVAAHALLHAMRREDAPAVNATNPKGKVMSFVFGKALLVITRDEDSQACNGERRYTTNLFVQHITMYAKDVRGREVEDPGLGEDWAKEEFGFMEYEIRAVPARCKDMEIGDTMRFSVTFVSHAWTDYWGEGDSDLEYRARLLRHQKFSRNRKRVKRYKLWLKQCAKKQSLQSSSSFSASQPSPSGSGMENDH